MIAAVPGLLTDAAAIVGAFTVIVGGLAAMWKVPPVRWVIRTLIVVPLGSWFRGEVSEATEDIRASADETAHLVTYHLGTNDTTMPWHERLSRLEAKHGLEPVQQQTDDTE